MFVNCFNLLDNENKEAHETPERCSPAEYHNKKADDQPFCYDILPVSIVQEFHGPLYFHCPTARQ